MPPVSDPRSMHAPTGTHEHGAFAAPTSPTIRSRSSAPGSPTPTPRASRSRTRSRSQRRRDGAPSVRHVLLRGVERGGVRLLHEPRQPKGSRARRQSARVVHGAVARARSPDLRPGPRRGGPRRRVGRVLRHRARARRRSARGRAGRASRSPTETSWSERLREATERFGGDEMPRPPFWGGYLLTPEEVEFWQGRPFRLHDRFRYAREATAGASSASPRSPTRPAPAGTFDLAIAPRSGASWHAWIPRS